VSQDGAISEISLEPNHGLGIAQVARISKTVAIDAYYTRHDEGHNTVVVIQDDGDVEQVWFKADSRPGSGPLGRVSGGADVAAFEDKDGEQHALILDGNGVVTEFSWKPSQGIARRTLLTAPGAIRLDAFQAADDGFIIVHLAWTDGTVREAFFQPGGNAGISVVAQIPEPIVDIASYYSPDKFRHVVALATSGAVYDF